MNLDIRCKNVNLSAENYKTMSVSIEDVEPIEVLENFNINEVIEYFGKEELIEAIGLDYIKNLHDLTELEEEED